MKEWHNLDWEKFCYLLAENKIISASKGARLVKFLCVSQIDYVDCQSKASQMRSEHDTNYATFQRKYLNHTHQYYMQSNPNPEKMKTKDMSN